MASTNDLKNGMVLDLDGQLWSVVWFQHHKPGKGNTVVRTKLKHVLSGKVVDRTFNSDTKVDTANVDRREMQYLYHDGSGFVFMDISSYEQLSIADETVGDAKNYLLEGQNATVAIHQEQPALPRPAGLGRAGDHLHRARSAGRPEHRWHQAGHRGDRSADPGSAVPDHRREGQGRHPYGRLPRPRRLLSRTERAKQRA